MRTLTEEYIPAEDPATEVCRCARGAAREVAIWARSCIVTWHARGAPRAISRPPLTAPRAQVWLETRENLKKKKKKKGDKEKAADGAAPTAPAAGASPSHSAPSPAPAASPAPAEPAATAAAAEPAPAAEEGGRGMVKTLVQLGFSVSDIIECVDTMDKRGLPSTDVEAVLNELQRMQFEKEKKDVASAAPKASTAAPAVVALSVNGTTSAFPTETVSLAAARPR